MNLVLHLDEIFLKGKNQIFFIRCLIKNIQILFPGIRLKRSDGGSFFLENFKVEDIERLSRVPGLANIAPVETGSNDLEEIKKMIVRLEFSPAVKSFRVSAVRSDKRFRYTSKELEVLLGDFVCEKYGWKVDLKNFDTEIKVEIGNAAARVYNKVIPGAGGLPTGSSGKVLVLLSGGIDSPVAAYQLMKRGAEVGLIHFQNQTKVTDEVSEKIIDLAKTLARYQPGINLYIVPFAGWQKEVVMKIPADYRMIVTRRLMFKIAEELAKKEKYLALATGDSLGQVASQTLENMQAIYQASDMLKLAPLMGSNKTEIVNIARRLGTLDISSRPYEDCCSLFVSRHPKTRAVLKDVLKMEEGMKPAGLDKKAIISYYIGIN